MKHKHAELMALYAQDAMETETPWERWEYRQIGISVWDTITRGHPNWLYNFEYRRKPYTIRIGNYDVPEPCREGLKKGTGYFYPQLKYEESSYHVWENDLVDKLLLKNGLVHLTKEAAEIHLKALLSLTKIA